MAKIPDTPKTTIERLLNVQKTVVEGLQFKSFALSVPSIWVNMSGLTILSLWNPRPRSRNQTWNLDPPGLPGLWTAGPPTCIFLGLSPRKLTLKKMTHPEK
ncbi:hypothetical protein DSO57_1031780 [Entomophthora muscae]|uniref:Uncharacterized protein n=1 Tax=Entomophthora muscae TaxID=34485 RepID=A0ACC2RRI0_9FUNG|nr:hypothetical protein DSO57_1031780 [Entomophthora muscae]